MTKNKLFLYSMLMILLGGLFIFEQRDDLHVGANGAVEVAPQVVQQSLSEISPDISVEVDDLLQIVYALERYKLDHRIYPISSRAGKGWDGILSNYGDSRKDWVRGLVPDYIDRLPRDPRMLDDGTRQYMYISNGAHYKLVVLRATNCQLIKDSHPSLVDPVRTCSAFGFWTKGAERW